jgi:hypothetical protein
VRSSAPSPLPPTSSRAVKKLIRARRTGEPDGLGRAMEAPGAVQRYEQMAIRIFVSYALFSRCVQRRIHSPSVRRSAPRANEFAPTGEIRHRRRFTMISGPSSGAAGSAPAPAAGSARRACSR